MACLWSVHYQEFLSITFATFDPTFANLLTATTFARIFRSGVSKKVIRSIFVPNCRLCQNRPLLLHRRLNRLEFLSQSRSTPRIFLFKPLEYPSILESLPISWHGDEIGWNWDWGPFSRPDYLFRSFLLAIGLCCAKTRKFRCTWELPLRLQKRTPHLTFTCHPLCLKS